MLSEKEKMLAGEMYDASCPELIKERKRAHRVCRTFNLRESNSASDLRELFKIFGTIGRRVYIESPFMCDYGYNIEIGDSVFFNFNVTILDCAKVTIGDGVKFGPGVQLYTAGHSLDPERRGLGDEFAFPIVIEENVWIGGSAIILPGVTIGKDAVVGAGSVVTKNVPPGDTVVGNPARPRR